MTLPIVFALGFCVGTLIHLLYRGESRRLKQTVLELPRGSLPVLALTLIVAICVLGTRLPAYRLTLYGGDVAGFVVGGLAGHWFFASESVASRGAFIAACAAALFLAALDYDHDLFRNMTKFNAAGVGVEFSEQRAEQSVDKWQRALSLLNAGPQKSPFPGAQALDYAISQLEDLADAAVRDEQYARLLSGDQPSQEQVKGPEDILGSARAFALFAKSTVVPIARWLDELQSFHRSETSTLSFDTAPLAALRRVYLLARAGMGSAEPVEPPYENALFVDTIARIGERLGSLGKSGNGIIDVLEGAMSDIEGEVQFYLWLRSGRSSSIDQALRQATDIIAREIEAERAAKLGDSESADGQRSPCDLLASETQSAEESDPRICFGYLALTIAWAEVAVGNAENAVHLLEAEINNQRTAMQEEREPSPSCQKEGAEKANCHRPTPVTLKLARRIILLRRLEAVQLGMIGLRQSRALDDVFVNRAIRLAGDEGWILQGFEKTSDLRRADYKTSPDGRSASPCESEFVPPLSSKAKLFSWIFVGQLAVESAALSAVAYNPHIVAKDPRIVAKLDGYAEDVSRLDFDCAKRLGSNFNWRVPAYFLESAAGYWEAKGEQFRVSANASELLAEVAPNSAATVKALCDARKTRTLAAEKFNAARSEYRSNPRRSLAETGENALDAEAQESIDQEFPLDQQSGLDRVDQDLSAFPAAERASACSGE
jgi:hypothetical protein